MRKEFLYLIFSPTPDCDYPDSNTLHQLRNLIETNGVLTDRIAKTISWRHHDINSDTDGE
jgi:hypothetical protein